MNPRIRAIHVERTADRSVLRWVVHHPSLTSAEPGARHVPLDSPLGALVDNGDVADVAVRDGDVLVRSSDADGWSTLAPKVQAALLAALDRLDDGTERWLLDAVGGTGEPPSLAEIQAIVDRAAGPVTGAHGGAMTVVAVDHTSVRLRAHGSCNNCSQSDTTVLALISPAIRTAHPGIVQVTIDAPTERPPEASAPRWLPAPRRLWPTRGGGSCH